MVRRSGGQSGYTLAALAVVVTLLGIALAAALPFWKSFDQREKEEELIFRGLQYAEAIRVFERRFGRDPVRLEELLEVKPRSIRQLWVDPMTGKADWRVVLASQQQRRGGQLPPGQAVVPGGGGAELTGGVELLPPANPEPLPGTAEDPNSPGAVVSGPIQGVYSRSNKESMKLFFDRQNYRQWVFMVSQVIAPGGAVGVGGDRLPSLSSRWIGRPMPFPIPGQLPGQQGKPPAQAPGQPPGALPPNTVGFPDPVDPDQDGT